MKGGTMVVADRPVLVPGGGRPPREEPTPRISGAGYLEAEGVAKGNPNIKAGSKVKIDGVGTSFGGTYVVSSCTHLFQGTHGYRTIFSTSGRSPRSLVDLMTPKGKRGWGNSVVIGDRHEQQRPGQARPRAREVPGARRRHRGLVGAHRRPERRQRRGGC